MPLFIDGQPTGLLTHDKGYRLHHTKWLHFTETGVLTGFQITEGRINVIPALNETPPDVDASRLHGTLVKLGAVMAETGLPMELEPVLFEIAVSEGEPAFEGLLPPLTAIIAAAGLEFENLMIVPAGFDWDEWLAAQAEEFE